MTAPHQRRQPRRYNDPKPVSTRYLADPYAADEDRHEKHVRQVLLAKPSGFPVFDMTKARAA